MDWKERLKELDKKKQWDEAIVLMQNVIRANSQDMDAYISINFLLMDLLVEEDCDPSKEQDYQTLLKWYFDESYAKFSDNAEYLYFTGKTAVMSPWFFGIDENDYEAMLEQAHNIEPENVIYKENYYYKLNRINPLDPELIAYAKMVLQPDSSVKKYLLTKGIIGGYILGMKEGWCECILYAAQLLEKSKISHN